MQRGLHAQSTVGPPEVATPAGSGAAGTPGGDGGVAVTAPSGGDGGADDTAEAAGGSLAAVAKAAAMKAERALIEKTLAQVALEPP